MYAAVAALQTAARRLQLSAELDSSEYAPMITQLRKVRDQLATFERRAGNQQADRVDLGELLREVTGPASAANDQGGSGIATQLSGDILVEGPVQDLRDLFCCLVEYALGVGPGPLNLKVEITRKPNEARETCVIGLIIQSSDVPDFLRRKLWEAARLRRGAVSVVSEPDCCRIGLMLPVERRVAAPS
jgi:hypothetical protein